jgi:hypothetical protein
MNADTEGMLRKRNTIWIGFEPREIDAFVVAKETAERNAPLIPVRGLVLDDLRAAGYYYRPTELRAGRWFDVISDHPMATEFAISRFLVPAIVQHGWAMFMDCDMLVRGDLTGLFEWVRQKFANKAVVCVPHKHLPISVVKMDDQVQSTYHRKNWSSVMLFNCEHPSNKALTVETVNTLPGRDLHQFCWLKDEEIGHIGEEWNYLVGHTKLDHAQPKIVHFTDGIPSMRGYEDCEYAGEWREELRNYARGFDFMRRLANRDRAQGLDHAAKVQFADDMYKDAKRRAG